MAKAITNTMAGTTSHDLTDLIGKKIKAITMQEVDIDGDSRNIRQFFHILCSDGERFVLGVDGGNSSQYARAELMDPDDFADFLEGIECEDTEDDDPPELGDEDAEDQFDDDENLFDDDEGDSDDDEDF